MDLRSLSIAVPTYGNGKNGRGCPNNCRFCVSAMDDNQYQNLIESNELVCERDYINRLNFCLERNFESLILTSTGEPLMNMAFLEKVAHWNRQTIKPFRWIEIQTSGVTLTEDKLKFLRNILGVTGISLSLSNIFDSKINAHINRTPDVMAIIIDDLCPIIKMSGFNLRLSLNMNDAYNEYHPSQIFHRAGILGANQITFRILYTSGDDTLLQNQWIKAHRYKNIRELNDYIAKNGTPLETMSSGAIRYDVDGISTIIDVDSMSTVAKDTVRYLILRPDCHLYTKWDSQGSLLF